MRGRSTPTGIFANAGNGNVKMIRGNLSNNIVLRH
jgi:hypothetical protein